MWKLKNLKKLEKLKPYASCKYTQLSQMWKLKNLKKLEKLKPYAL